MRHEPSPLPTVPILSALPAGALERLRAVAEQKAGKVEFRIEKGAIVHAPVGKRSFGPAKLKDNFLALLEAVNKAKPSAAKGTYIRSIAISATMSPGIRLDTAQM